MPTQHHPSPITLAAATVVAEASGLGILTASLLADVVDITTAAVLGSVGLDAVEIRRTAAANWGRVASAFLARWRRAVQRGDELAALGGRPKREENR